MKTKDLTKEHLIEQISALQDRVNNLEKEVLTQRQAKEALRLSENNLATILEMNADGIVIVDMDGTVLYVNPAAEKLFNKSEEEFLGYPFGFPIIKDDPEISLSIINGGVITEVLGRVVQINWLNRPALQLSIRDITRRKRAEEELRLSEEKFRSIMENSADAIFLTNPQGKYIYTNKAVTAMLGYTAKEMTNKTILDITPPDKAGEYFEVYKRVLNEGKAFYELELIKKDGKHISTDLNAAVLPDGFVYASCRDITERKQAEKEIKDLNESLEKKVIERTAQFEAASQAKSEFLANMSHEIRTPMNAVLGYSELLSELLINETQKRYLNSIKTSGRSLLTLINDILDLSKIEAGKLELEFSYISARPFFNEMTEVFSYILCEKNLEFIVDISSSTPEGICIDEIRVRQVLINLIGNAIKFTKDGIVKLSVHCENPQILTINKTRSEEYIDLVIEVEDTGMGISKQLQTEIFNAFQQGDGQTSKKFGGTGLGLTITRKLLELMKGTISVRSKTNKGSIFRVVIPDVAYVRDFKETINDFHFDTSLIEFDPASILIADDVESNRKLIIDALKDTPLTIYEAKNGKLAYSMALEIEPHLIIADIRMPVTDGFKLAKLIKSDPKLRDTPVMAYTASAMKSQKEKILTSNFDGLLSKPIRIEELFLELSNFLPCKIIEKEQTPNPDSINDILPVLSLDDIQFIDVKLTEELHGTWSLFANNQPLDLVREFGNSIKELGDKFKLNMFTNYGADLISAANSFDIELILTLINRYPQMVNKFRTETNIGR